MRLFALLPIAALAALIAGAASGQPTPSSATSDQPIAASTAGTPAAATIGVTSSPTPADQAYLLKAGEPNVVSNGPVPDTAANRRLYGGPMSNAGRHTAPAGN
jgi:hypothetical protein